MDIKEIHELMKLASDLKLEEVTIKTNKIEVTIKGQQQPAQHQTIEPYMAQLAAQSLQAVPPAMLSARNTTGTEVMNVSKSDIPALEQNTPKTFKITSPIVGTLYLTPSPNDPPFVKIGDDIKPKQVLCIVEAMKIFNEIEAEVSGKLVKILVDSGSPVEFGQAIFEVELTN